MKKLILLFVFTFAMTSCNSDKEYHNKFNDTLENIRVVATKSGVYADSFIKVWRIAIEDSEYNGQYCHDFYSAITMHKESLEDNKEYRNVREQNSKIKEDFKILCDYPSKYKEAYFDLVELYTLVEELNNSIYDIQGSLVSYSDRKNELMKEINTRYSNIKLKYLQN